MRKESHFRGTGTGGELLVRYDEVRLACLIVPMNLESQSDIDIPLMTRRLRAISGIYEQATRTTIAW